jgi:hypothetical protein
MCRREKRLATSNISGEPLPERAVWFTLRRSEFEEEKMVTPPKFPGQVRLEELLEQFKAEQEEKEGQLRKEFEDLREERKIGLQRWALGISLLALVASIASGAWNARIAYKSLTTARRGFVAARLQGLSKDGTQVTFDIRVVPPNPALHIRLEASCGTYVENGRKPEDVLKDLALYETNLTLAPGDGHTYTCNTGSSAGMHAPHGIIQKSVLGLIQDEDLAGNRYRTQFCFDRAGISQQADMDTLVACPTHNDAN